MSTILLVGARGFIGRRLWAALDEAGHVVRPVSRSWAGQRVHGAVTADLAVDTTPESWLPRLPGVDVVINAAGVFAGSEAVHTSGPKALFAAANQTGVRRVIQISALGAESASTAYFATKNEADRFLMSLPLEAVVLRPSLVFGLDGRSSRLFMQLATLPLLVLPRAASRSVQPVHVDDVVQAVLQLVEGPVPRSPIPLVGGRALGLCEFLGVLRCRLGYPPAWVIMLPDAMMTTLGRLPGLGRYLGPDPLRMLAGGSTADTQSLSAVLGRTPRRPEDFVPGSLARAVGTEAILSWMAPLLHLAVAALWIWTGVVSLALYPRELSHALLERTGIPLSWQPAALYGAALLDIALGLLVWPMRQHAWLWRLQIVVITGYTLIITVFLSEFWLHPYGPITKNIPLLALLYLLQLLGTRRWNT